MKTFTFPTRTALRNFIKSVKADQLVKIESNERTKSTSDKWTATMPSVKPLNKKRFDVVNGVATKVNAISAKLF